MIVTVASLAAAALLGVAPPPGAGTRPPEPAAGRVSQPSAAPVSREELARSYLFFDAAVAPRWSGWSEARRAEVSREFDAITLLYFGGSMADANARLDALTASSLTLDAAQRERIVALLRPRLQVEPAVVVGEHPTVELRVLDGAGDGDAAAAWAGRTVVIHDPSGATRSVPAAGRIELVGGASARPGRYRLALTTADAGVERPIGAVNVLPEPPAAIAARLQSRLDEVERRGRGRDGDRAAVASALRLLTDRPSTARSAEFLADQAAVAARLGAELDAIEADRSPWRGWRGDAWRTIRAVALDVPCRVHVPPSLPAGAKPPLVIALHGAGGDESMFLDAYGAGRLAALADEKGFVVVAPATAVFASTPVVFDAIVEEMVHVADVDPERVIVMGHSMGAGAAATIGAKRADRIAGIVLFAGMGGGGDTRWPPVRVVAGGLDPLFQLERVKAAADTMRKAGCDVTWQVYPEAGHTMVVTADLDAAVAWALERPRRTAPGR